MACAGAWSSGSSRTSVLTAKNSSSLSQFLRTLASGRWGPRASQPSGPAVGSPCAVRGARGRGPLRETFRRSSVEHSRAAGADDYPLAGFWSTEIPFWGLLGHVRLLLSPRVRRSIQPKTVAKRERAVPKREREDSNRELARCETTGGREARTRACSGKACNNKLTGQAELTRVRPLANPNQRFGAERKAA